MLRPYLTRLGVRSNLSFAGRVGERYHLPMINLLAVLTLVAGVQDTTLSVIPKPARMTRGTGSFVVTPTTVVVTDRATRDIGYQLADWLQPATGYRLSVGGAAGAATHVVSLRIDPTLSRLGDEGYRLSVTPTRITIRAFRPAGRLSAL